MSYVLLFISIVVMILSTFVVVHLLENKFAGEIPLPYIVLLVFGGVLAIIFSIFIFIITR